jgi:glycosyltransferase involved in cell wall biosynthesis
MLCIDSALKNSPLKLVIVGGGEETETLTKLIHRLGLQEKVQIVNRVPYSDMPKIHNLADIFVLPSISTPKWQEQFGAVLTESMACAKPVVGASSGAIPEVLGDAGLIAQTNEFSSIADKLKELIINSELRSKLSKRARQRAVNCYDSRPIAQKIQRIYESL